MSNLTDRDITDYLLVGANSKYGNLIVPVGTDRVNTKSLKECKNEGAKFITNNKPGYAEQTDRRKRLLSELILHIHNNEVGT